MIGLTCVTRFALAEGSHCDIPHQLSTSADPAFRPAICKIKCLDFVLQFVKLNIFIIDFCWVVHHVPGVRKIIQYQYVCNYFIMHTYIKILYNLPIALYWDLKCFLLINLKALYQYQGAIYYPLVLVDVFPIEQLRLLNQVTNDHVYPFLPILYTCVMNGFQRKVPLL